MVDIFGARKGEGIHSPVVSHDYAIMSFWAGQDGEGRGQAAGCLSWG